MDAIMRVKALAEEAFSQDGGFGGIFKHRHWSCHFALELH